MLSTVVPKLFCAHNIDLLMGISGPLELISRTTSRQQTLGITGLVQQTSRQVNKRNTLLRDKAKLNTYSKMVGK